MRDFTGFYIDCKSADPSKVFCLVVKDVDAVMTSVNFKARFSPPDSREFGRVLIPLSSLDTPERFGRPILRPPMDPSALGEVGLMILKPSTGAFALQVREIGVYR